MATHKVVELTEKPKDDIILESNLASDKVVGVTEKTKRWQNTWKQHRKL